MSDPADVQDRLSRLRRGCDEKVQGIEEITERELRSREHLFRAREGLNRDRPLGRSRTS